MSKLKHSIQDLGRLLDIPDYLEFKRSQVPLVKATIRATGEIVGISHTYMTQTGIECLIELPDGKCINGIKLDDLDIEDHHVLKELLTFEATYND